MDKKSFVCVFFIDDISYKQEITAVYDQQDAAANY